MQQSTPQGSSMSDIPVREERVREILARAQYDFARQQKHVDAGFNGGDNVPALHRFRDMIALCEEVLRLRTAQPKGDARLLTDEQIEEMRKWFNGPGTEQFQAGEVIALLFDHIGALQSAPSAQPKGESGVTPFIVKHYSDDERPIIKGNGFDGLEVGETRNEAEGFIKWVNAHLRSPAACAASQETARPVAWMKGYRTSSPMGDDYDVDLVEGRDPPAGEGWIPLYLRPDESKAQMTEAELSAIDHVCRLAAEYPKSRGLKGAIAKVIVENIALVRSLANRLGEK